MAGGAGGDPVSPGRQLTLDLAAAPGFGREDFFISGSNESAYAMVELWPNWPDAMLLVLAPAGAGKSHLGAIWAARAEARILSAAELMHSDKQVLAARPLLIEDADAIGEAEIDLFHLVNLMRERGAPLVLTARTRPDAWGLGVPDLLSRLRLAPVVEIGTPDDALMRAVLVKLFIDRQLIVDASTIEFAALRLERSLYAARAFVADLDREAMSRKSRITRPMVAEVLRRHEVSGENQALSETESDSCDQDDSRRRQTAARQGPT
ncbi:hypothetical protein [Methylocapsa acidiphila]|uniref:hypothetical protein n=1 Tax=Methylocapsa acidiphila TaxID=133552 RepID=UPI0006867CDC|nr:hypothetical protein [Methylocapsa acidiphila]